MNKQWVFSLMPLLFLCVQAKEVLQDDLSPETRELLAITTREQTDAFLLQNSYPGLLTINSPENIDFQEVGRAIVKNNQENIIKALTMKNRSELLANLDRPFKHYRATEAINIITTDKHVSTRCSKPGEEVLCLKKLMTDKTSLSTLIDKNSLLLNRYQQLKKLPHFVSDQLFNNQPTPEYATLKFLSMLNTAKGALLIAEKQVEEGLQVIDEEIGFAKKMLNGTPSITAAMNAYALLSINYHIIQQSFDEGFLDIPHISHIQQTLLAPLTRNEEEGLLRGITSAYQANILTYHVTEPVNFYNARQMAQKMKPSLDPVYYMYNPMTTANMATLRYNEKLSAIKVSLPEAINYYQETHPQQDKNFATSANTETLLAEAKKYAAKLPKEKLIAEYGEDNGAAAVLFAAEPNFTPDIYRLYDLMVYLKLVKTKLLILEYEIKPEVIPYFLAELGDEATNPFTQEPFTWNAHKKELSTSKLSFPAQTIKVQIINS